MARATLSEVIWAVNQELLRKRKKGVDTAGTLEEDILEWLLEFQKTKNGVGEKLQ